MAADQTLVEGAFRASRDYSRVADEAKISAIKNLSEGISSIGSKMRQQKEAEDLQQQQQISEAQKAAQKEQIQAAKEEEARQKKINSDWDKASSNVLDSDGVTPGNHDAMYDNVSLLKQEYMSALNELPPNKKKASRIMADLNSMGGDLDLFRQTQVDIASDKKGNQFSVAVSEENKNWYKSLQSGEIQPTFNEDGKLGVVGPDGKSFVPVSNIEDILQEDRVDVESQNALTDLRQGLYEMGRDGDHTASFDEESVKSSIQNIIKNGNVKSIFNDPMFGTTSMATDLLEQNELNGLNYGDLGFSAEEIGKLDKNRDGKVNEEDKLSIEDKKSIVKMLGESNDSDIEDVRNNMMANYFLMNAKANWTKGNNKAIDKYNRDNPENPYTREVINEQGDIVI